MSNHAKYSSVYDPALDAIFVVDLCAPMCLSVTNDAEHVVAEVVKQHGNKAIVYRDTAGQWDILAHTNGMFTGFKFGGEGLYEAIERSRK